MAARKGDPRAIAATDAVHTAGKRGKQKGPEEMKQKRRWNLKERWRKAPTHLSHGPGNINGMYTRAARRDRKEGAGHLLPQQEVHRLWVPILRSGKDILRLSLGRKSSSTLHAQLYDHASCQNGPTQVHIWKALFDRKNRTVADAVDRTEYEMIYVTQKTIKGQAIADQLASATGWWTHADFVPRRVHFVRVRSWRTSWLAIRFWWHSKRIRKLSRSCPDLTPRGSLPNFSQTEVPLHHQHGRIRSMHPRPSSSLGPQGSGHWCVWGLDPNHLPDDWGLEDEGLQANSVPPSLVWIGPAVQENHVHILTQKR